ncbi:MAG: lipid-A-disaccharide synthase [Acidobacteriota bacterium]|nr:lipid-A-disaccharide synthase [Acidobacteriota bacterium]
MMFSMVGQHDESIRLMIVAGEASGDAHAAALVRALREKAPGARFEFFGATEREMRAAGVESIVCADDLAIVGLLEVGRALPKFWEAYKTLKASALARRPDAAILVDWPDFNLPLARALHRRGIKVIYYISPQLWAWRARRVRNIRRDVDLLLAILPFEPEWYKKRGITHVEFVGHPLTGEVRPRYGRAEFCARHNLDPSRPLIAFLPGSRRKELQRILPPMIDAAQHISHERPDAQFVVALAPTRSSDEARTIIDAALSNGLSESGALRVAQHETREALAAADAAAVASGTATLEAALTETPLVVVYKESALNWHTLGRLIDVEHFGLVNLIAGERLATELMQDDFTGETLARELLQLLDPERNALFRARLRAATARLGAGGASDHAAESVLRAVRAWRGMKQQQGSGVRGQGLE